MDDNDRIDEAEEESFPASDPPANTTETGIHVKIASMSESVIDNQAANQFELVVDGQTAFLAYERSAKSLVLIHTEVPVVLRGRHLGDALAKAAIDSATKNGLRVVAVCPFVKAYLRKHPLA
ncbi:MAG TPA: GNAT family N-acetyltransferase [Vicinamibacterales bacterium]|nr:GNAT family N-acetyltransferase [Vicinamibacterales bacterium]